MDIFQKCYNFTAAKEVMALGLYPYFHPLSSGQDTGVVIDGKAMIMMCSSERKVAADLLKRKIGAVLKSFDEI